MMTSRQRIEAALTGLPVDHLPFSPFLAYVWEHFPEEVRERGMLEFHHRIGADPLWRGAPCPVRAVPPAGVEERWIEGETRRRLDLVTPVGALAQEWRLSDAGQTWFMTEHPLKTPEDYRVQTWIEARTEMVFDPAPVAAHFAGDGREGLSFGLLIPRMKSAFQHLVETLAGTEALAYALADFPDVVEALWRTMVARDLEAARLAIRSDYGWFTTWEDSSTQNYSPSQYRTYIASEIGQWCALVAGAGKRYVQHACGHVRELIEPMREQGVCAIESLSTPPTGNVTLAEARRVAGAEMGIIGGIEPTHFLNLSPDELEAYAERAAGEAAGGPFVLANADSCPPGVTVEKFARVAAVARRIG